MTSPKDHLPPAAWIAAALDLLLPPRCVACSRVLPGTSTFCERCWQAVEALGESCPTCALPGAGEPCPACRDDPPPFGRARSAFLYGGQVVPLIHRLKYSGAAHLCRPLGSFLARALEGAGRPELLVPVPLHRRRLVRRGYNQAMLLAQEVTRHTGVRCGPSALVRLRPTQSQARLDHLQRRSNVEGAFRACPAQVRGLSILLVDDVMTTGATARACAAALLEAGAREVGVLTLARAVIQSWPAADV